MLPKGLYFGVVLRPGVQPAILNWVIAKIVMPPEALNYAPQVEASSARISRQEDVHEMNGIRCQFLQEQSPVRI
jgi:hypothetical protein